MVLMMVLCRVAPAMRACDELCDAVHVRAAAAAVSGGSDLNYKNLLQPRIVGGNMEWIQEPRQRRPIFRGKHDGHEDSHEIIDVSANIGRRGT